MFQVFLMLLFAIKSFKITPRSSSEANAKRTRGVDYPVFAILSLKWGC
ncbi:hypothetical protein AsAng_0019740 [Aureispira anguillae]|uniref:Uncharacterized protein n=1 Tax=Aureispira anguillae TaxID=2864201 RepID=A0A916DST0_9BACT|nr:hypothetical protein AsAng_0019740 [Aureispira anguillae]